MTENDLEYVIWEESYNYVVPWNEAEDVSTLIESKAAISYPNHCGLFSKSAAASQPFTDISDDDFFGRRGKRSRERRLSGSGRGGGLGRASGKGSGSGNGRGGGGGSGSGKSNGRGSTATPKLSDDDQSTRASER